MTDTVIAALIAGIVGLTSSILTFIVGIRSIRRSVATSNGLPLGALLETRITQIDTRLASVEHSLGDLREQFAFRDGWIQGRRDLGHP